MPEETATKTSTPKVASGQTPTAASGSAVEQIKNCPACKKLLKKARRYYRNGAYYCNVNCFKKVHVATS